MQITTAVKDIGFLCSILNDIDDFKEVNFDYFFIANQF